MKIVIEYVLLENLLINLIILKTTSILTKERGRLFLLFAFLNACITVALPALNLSTIGAFFVQIGVSMPLVCFAFKFKTFKKFVQLELCYFVSNFIYGGACFFFEGAFGIRSTLIVLAVVIVTYFIVKYLDKRLNRKKCIDTFCYDVVLESQGKESTWKAFLDSGNLLFDPLTESPVSLINFKVFSTLFSDIALEDVLRKSDKLKNLKFAHYISFNTLNNNDKILVFQVDMLKINSVVVEKATLGLCFKNFNQAFGSDIILHNALIA